MFRPAPLLFFSRKMSFFSIFKSWGNSCEKVDCTKPMPMPEPPEKYVIEKSCCPCIFETWRPKIPELRSDPIKTHLLKQLTPVKECKPGMKVTPRSRCEIEAEARECEKRNHPKWLKHCPPRSKNETDGPLPVLKECNLKCKKDKGKIERKRQPKSMRKKCPPQVPTPDWNHDGSME